MGPGTRLSEACLVLNGGNEIFDGGRRASHRKGTRHQAAATGRGSNQCYDFDVDFAVAEPCTIVMWLIVTGRKGRSFESRPMRAICLTSATLASSH